MEITKSAQQYEKNFNPQMFLQQRFHQPGTPLNQFRDLRMKLIHELFEKIDSDNKFGGNGIKVLDYGCGPVISFVISAAGVERVSQIVLAEFTERNREAITDWIHRDKTAFDWRPYFKHVVTNLENKSESHLELREERLRSLATVVSCDIKAGDPIEKGYEGPYDVVMTFLAIESACSNETEFTSFIAKLAKLVKQNGILYIFSKLSSTSQAMYYEFGGEMFYYYAVTKEVMLNSIKKAGFSSVECKEIPIAETLSGLTAAETAQLEIHPESDQFTYASICCRKM